MLRLTFRFPSTAVLLSLLVLALNAGADAAADRLALEAAVSENKRDLPALLALARLCLATGDVEAGEQAVKAGLKYARDHDTRLDFYATSIRLANARDDFDDAERSFRRARRLKNAAGHAETQLAMAVAYIRERAFDDARESLNRALAVDSPYREEAASTLANLQLVERASLVTDSPFAFALRVSRGEVAALITDQFQIARSIGQTRDVSQPAPGETSDQGLTDYAASPYRDAIVSVHRLGVRSLNIKNGAFRPEAPISRVELAIIVEDVLAATQGVSRTQFIGTSSPFSDLSSSSTGFNAVMTAVTRGLMQGSDTGAIHPGELVSGAEAILVLDRLNTLLQKAT